MMKPPVQLTLNPDILEISINDLVQDLGMQHIISYVCQYNLSETVPCDIMSKTVFVDCKKVLPIEVYNFNCFVCCFIS